VEGEPWKSSRDIARKFGTTPPEVPLMFFLTIRWICTNTRGKQTYLTLRRLMSYIYIYIYGAPILDVSRSHTTTGTVGRTPLDE